MKIFSECKLETKWNYMGDSSAQDIPLTNMKTPGVSQWWYSCLFHHQRSAIWKTWNKYLYRPPEFYWYHGQKRKSMEQLGQLWYCQLWSLSIGAEHKSGFELQTHSYEHLMGELWKKLYIWENLVMSGLKSEIPGHVVNDINQWIMLWQWHKTKTNYQC